jgi:hypothetical protein
LKNKESIVLKALNRKSYTSGKKSTSSRGVSMKDNDARIGRAKISKNRLIIKVD